jgi:hypothetical protein
MPRAHSAILGHPSATAVNGGRGGSHGQRGERRNPILQRADGYQNSRVQIQLSDFDGNTLAFIRFKDPGMLDAVRNEKADIYYWTRVSDH